jgi:hypothetical protein
MPSRSVRNRIRQKELDMRFERADTSLQFCNRLQAARSFPQLLGSPLSIRLPQLHATQRLRCGLLPRRCIRHRRGLLPIVPPSPRTCLAPHSELTV